MRSDDLQEWHNHPVSIELMELMQEARDQLVEAMANGHFLNLGNMNETFAATAKAVGTLEGIDFFLNMVKETKDED